MDEGNIWHLPALAGVVASVLLFRRAAVQLRFARQVAWLVAAAALGVGSLVLAKGFGFSSLLLLALGLYVIHWFLRPPKPGRYYSGFLYQSGFWYLFLLNSLAVRCEWGAMAVFSAFYFAAYAVLKFCFREYETA